MDITETLSHALAMDGVTRNKAETKLKELQQQDLPCFLLSLANELKNDDKPWTCRKLAAILLKNTLILKWISLDNNLRAQIKALLLGILDTPSLEIGSLVIVEVSNIELLQDNWPEILPSLSMVDQLYAPQATLNTLRYIFEDITPFAWYEYRHEIMNKLVKSSLEENSDIVRHAAILALNSALLGYPPSSIFSATLERDDVIETVLKATLCGELKIRKAAFKCLVTITSKFYYELEPHISSFAAVTRGARDMETALHAIGVWISICRQEDSIIRKSLCYRPSLLQSYIKGDSTGFNRTITMLSRCKPCFHIVRETVLYLAPALFEAMEKASSQELIKVAFECLQLVSQFLEGTDDGYMIHLASKFVEKNSITKEGHLGSVAGYVYRLILLQERKLVLKFKDPSSK